MIKNFFLTIIGITLLLVGIVLVLREWPSVVTVFKGVAGGALAVAGLVVLFAATIKK